MYNTIDWDIEFKTEGGKKYRLGMLAECEIVASVENLADTATIVLPEAYMNQVFDIGDKLPRGTSVTIKAGYNGKLENEFTGFIQDITTNDSSLKIICEDALYLFRQDVRDVELKPTSVKKITQLLIAQVDSSYALSCDFDINYEKFVIHQATAYDVLKKIAEETKANIYFDTENKTLHIHPPYVEKGGDVIYSMQVNVENSSLEYKRAQDRKVEVTVESTNIKGEVQSYTTGTTGGDKVTFRTGSVPAGELEKIAKAELIKRSFDGYTGSIDTWLVPFVKPTFSAVVRDEDYPYKTGRYYVVAVTTNVGPDGGKRKVELGVKLGNG